MSVRKSFKTKKGTELPLMSLKGREYLQVAHRLVWLTEEAENYTIETEFLKLEETWAIAKTKISIFDKEGKLIKSASATKRETQKDFPDFIEKAETGSMGRALAMLSFGTQFAEADLDEGSRLADSPLEPKPAKTSELQPVSEVAAAPASKVKSFRTGSTTKPQASEGGWE